MKTIKHETYEEMKARHRREAMYHFINETSKLGFALCAFLWSMFALYMWGPMIARGVQSLVGSW